MAEPQGKLLIVDDDEDILVAGRLLLRRYFAEVITCSRPADIESLMQEHEFDAILLDMNFSPGESSGQQGFFWLRRILELDAQAVVVLITAHGGVDIAVDAMKLGATDFIAKPWQNEKVVATVTASAKLRRSLREGRKLQQANQELAQLSAVAGQPMLGNSSAMRSVHTLIERSAPTDANVLVLGENGTGKELVARALHQHSKRSEKIFVSVDLGAIAESLFESELFGHMKGAFTDARDNRIGRFQAAEGGTLFLDEIGNLPLHLQAKLLTVLEQRQVTPVGANKAVAIDVRVIAATNVPRETLADENRFRQDLLFRLNTVEIMVPPLRERREDIALIVDYYLASYARKYSKPQPVVAHEAMTAILADDWPGNVRALRHAIERAVILAPTDELSVQDFHLPLSKTARSEPHASAASDNEDLNLTRMEKQAIELALRKHQFNISHAARELGLTRAALYRRMEKHGI
ncbi:sigma-54 dependent transcriptional regulator [Congregibacter variabilis]|uniref:Sigma-54 dependent transcriptional regulator n=1 Tax=Congregibacter variabilis TaxID=3081200 RepID=A0ABZ0I6V4_9GAMM|nr:sigma-54 dependent transcriptional regulator [Congregibacter sp. IMCC43200]